MNALLRRRGMIVGKKKSVLPPEYQQVEWIGYTDNRSGNPPVIYLGQTLTNKLLLSDYEFSFVISDLTTRFSGSQVGIVAGSSTGAGCYFCVHKGKIAMAYDSDSALEPLTKREYVLSWDASGGLLKANNQIATQRAFISTTGEQSFYIGSTNSSNYAENFKCYGAKLKYQGGLIRNCLPCYRKSDGKNGMYDVITKAFYTNSGTGSFTKGANV